MIERPCLGHAHCRHEIAALCGKPHLHRPSAFLHDHSLSRAVVPGDYLYGRRKSMSAWGRRLGAASIVASTTHSKDALANLQLQAPWGSNKDMPVNLVVKFGGSSLASAERMAEVASIVCSLQDTCPAVVLSAMGKTTNLLLQAGQEALDTPPGSISSLAPLR